MNRHKLYRRDKRDLGLCQYSGCDRKAARDRSCCRFHLALKARQTALYKSRKRRPPAPFVWVG